MENYPAHQMTVSLLAYTITRLVQEFEAIENRDPIPEFMDKYIFSTRSGMGSR